MKEINSVEEKYCDTCKQSYFDCSQYKDVDKREKEVHNPEKLGKLQELQIEQYNMYKIKNAKYGDSFGKSVKKYGLIAALTRMSDKFNRIETLILNHDDGTDDESLRDSLIDISAYALMTILELEVKNDIQS